MATEGPPFEELLRGAAQPAAADLLARYATLLEQWSARHNLVRFGSRRELVARHLLEALAAAELMEEEGVLVDVGSGAGLPGIPLLCAKPGWRGVLLEPRQKRWAFLKLVVRELGLSARVEQARFQEAAVSRADLVTARAVGGHEAMLAWARPRLSSGGRVMIWGTKDEEQRLRRLSGWHVVSSRLISLDRGRLIQLQVCST